MIFPVYAAKDRRNMQHELASPEYNRLRRIAHICASQLPEPFAVDALLMLYDVCRAHELTPDELNYIFGRQGLAFVQAGRHTAPRENPVVYSKMDLTWDRPFVVTQIGCIGPDGTMHEAEDASEGGNAFLMQEIFRRRRSGEE
jgi:hypothetical protein